MKNEVLQVRKDQLDEVRLITEDLNEIGDGEILVKVGKFAFTSNNVTYGVVGEQIGYWKFFPCEDGWGVIPVWGYAKVVKSRCESIEEGETFYGYFPMGQFLVMTPSTIKETNFMDASPHRKDLPFVYNNYVRVDKEPVNLSDIEDQRAILFPLFGTSYIMWDFFTDNEFFGAKQVLVGSASSKTGIGFAQILSQDKNLNLEIVGLTSSGNKGFVESLGYYDSVVTYDQVAQLDANVPSLYVDMSGSASTRLSVHTHFADNLTYSCGVGITHWDESQVEADLPGPRPAMFFAPGQIDKRNKEWGIGELGKRAFGASAELARSASWMTVQHFNGGEGVLDAYMKVLSGKISPDTGYICTL